MSEPSWGSDATGTLDLLYCTPRFPAVLAVALSIPLAACGAGNDGKGPKGPPEVGFTVVRATSVPLVTELPGRTSAFLTAEVRPQITGVIQRRLFTEGALVRKGQSLYQIDSSLYRAAAGQASANLAAAQASAAAAAAKADRYKPLAAERAVSQQDYTDAAAQARATEAQVAQTRAALQTAQVNLHFTTVPAPVTGRIGRSLLTEGALATSGQAGPLAVISVLDPLYVDIQQSAADVLKLRRAGSGGQLAQHVDVKLLLDDGSDYPFTGSLEFSEVTVDPATGTVTLRARFPNPDNLLLPGMFVRTRLARGNQDHVWLVPQGAVSRDPRGNATVFVVGPGNKALVRPVNAERTVGADWVVTGGLQDGDRLITQGLGKVKPGQPVRPVPDSKPQQPRTPGKGH
ncbi:MAG: efflux RND transporter periplasmic adaptor subunit [Sphingomonadales bacterium]|nr:efflux RND transporter periplasmic adaptor subunit [Sphingomonadales bacterium]